MAHFLEQYTRMIKSCNDYDSLANALDICISKNVVNHVNDDLKGAIDSLGFTTPYTKFIRSLVWASTVSDYNETSLNILRYFCNKAVSEIDSLVYPPDDFSSMVFVICADNKQFIKKLSKDTKVTIAKTLSNWYLALTDNDLKDDWLFKALATSMDLIIDGKTMGDLDKEFKDWHKDSTLDNIDTDITHQSSQVLRPFQALFINIAQNIDQSTLLHTLNVHEWENSIEEKMKDISTRYTKLSKNDNLYDSYYLFLRDTLMGFDMLNKKLVSTGYSNIVNPVVGEFILGFLNVLHYNYDHFDVKEITMILRDAQNLYFSNFAASDSTRNIVNVILASYCNTGDYEDSLLRGDYFDALKMHLKGDELFKAWLEHSSDSKFRSIPDRIVSTYIHHYLNPALDDADKLIEAQEQTLDIAIEADIKKNSKKKKVVDEEPDDESENTNTDNDENDEEEPQPEDDLSDTNEDEEYDGPEIEAKQSNKGYKKASKRQADGERKIYGAYKKYKDNEAKVDSQLSKMLSAAKRAFTQDKTEEIIEGKKFTPLGLLKKILITGAIFNYSKVAGFIYLLVSHTISKKRTIKQKNEILIQIDTELKMIDEKIEDARGDGNRKAKYALMRTKAELERARAKIKYNLTATKQDMKIAKKYVNNDYRDNV